MRGGIILATPSALPQELKRENGREIGDIRGGKGMGGKRKDFKNPTDWEKEDYLSTSP